MEKRDGLLHADAIPCGLLAIGDDGTLLAVNGDLADMVGSSVAELTNKHIDYLFAPAARVLYHSYIFPQIKLHGHVEEIETSLRNSEHRKIDILFSARRTVDADKPIIHGIVIKLRERKRLEEQLINMRLAAQYLPGIMFQLLKDIDGNYSIPFASEAMRTFFGLNPVTLINDATALWNVIAAQDLSNVRDSLHQSDLTGTEWRSKFRSNVGGKTRWLEAHAAPQRRSDNTTLWHGYISDITERYDHEQALIEKESAERASQAKSEFLARMSHELRTPLNSILGFARILDIELSNKIDPHELQQLNSIETSGRDLLLLINEVLDISRIEAGRIKFDIGTIWLQPLLEKIVSLMEPVIHENKSTVDLDVEAGVTLSADPQRLQQVLTNLISNALKYNRVNGRIIVKATTHGRRVRIDIRDQGRGLNEKQLRTLFQPFNRVGAEHSGIEGVGLGLVIARALTEQMGGSIEVTSTVGQGSCFTVELSSGDSAITADIDEPVGFSPQVITHGVRRVLYVEDNPVNVLLMQSLFKLRPSYQLSIAITAADALEKLQSEIPQLLLIDMQLPDASGSELLAAIRGEDRWKQIPAIAVSADAMPEDIAAALKNGFGDYWTKPLNIDKTLHALDQVFAPRGDQGGSASAQR